MDDDIRRSALAALDFGRVDAESEADLDQRFVRTADFERFAREEIWVALGPKGTGKSALFEVFAKHEDLARRLGGGALDDVLLTAGTGFADLSQLATGDIERLKSEDGYDHDRLWRLYIAIRGAIGIADAGLTVERGPLRDLLQALGREKDLRILPLMQSLWRLAVGDAPGEISVAAGGATVTIRGGRRTLDVVGLLQDVQETLERTGKRLWIFFDKIDEIFPADPDERRAAIEGLFSASMAIRRQFPLVQPKILVRTDLWRELNFTNKSHLGDKRVELEWSKPQLATMLLKRAVAQADVRSVVEDRVSALKGQDVETLSDVETEEGLRAIFPETVYPGEREAQILDWLVTRVTDAQGTLLPRESIMLGNQAAAEQRKTGEPAAEADNLLSREAVREAFTHVSQERVGGYLAEFPDISEHLKRFRGQTTSTFSRDELNGLFDGLEPSGIDVLDRLFEVGVLRPLSGTTVTATEFEVPRLYRVGLGLVIRGRA